MNANTSIRSGHEVARRLSPTRIALLLALAYAPQMAAAAEESQGTLEAVEVTASPVGESYTSTVSVGGKEAVKPREIANSVSVITEQRIQDQNLKTVSEALEYATGVTVTANEDQTSQFRARGHYLGVSYDGIPNGTIQGVQQLDLPIYEQVEILRGPAGVFAGTETYGAGLGGTVNLVRKRARNVFGVSGSAGVGSWANYRGEVDVTGPLNEAKTVRGRAVFSAQDRDYFYDRTHTRKLLGYATLDFDITPSTTVSLAFTSQNDDTDAMYFGLPAEAATGRLLKGSRSANPAPRWNESTWETQDYIAELEHRFDNQWTAKIKLNHRDQNASADYAFVSSALSATNTVSYRYQRYDVDYRRDAVDVFLSGPFRLLGREHRALVGYNWYKAIERADYSYGPTVTGLPFGGPVPQIRDPYNNDTGWLDETRQSGYYGQLRLSVTEPLTVIVGGRFSDYSNRTRDASPSPRGDWVQYGKENDHFTPYAGVIYDLNRNYSVYASYADLFVPQYARKADGSMLDPREGRQAEVGIKGEFFDGRLQASAAYFNLRDTNRPYADPDNPGFYLNQGEVESKGWELEVSGSPAPG
ncbi:MAG: TonB-dependent siderophore receptor, partial [Candidatus Accumulibacter sp.]|nr:TonB-dependent siderophore receptor [Accumulibacter sp.]